MVLRHTSLLVKAGTATALVLVLAACTPGGQFDPTTIFANDMFDNKKKLQGNREPVFPNGVPGTTSGVPQDLYKGYQPPPDQAADADTGGAPPAAAAEPEKPKPKPKPKVAAAPAPHPHPTRISVGPAGSSPPSAPPAAAPAPPPANWPAAPAPSGAQSPWPDPPKPQ
jgi:hypothetical protein